MKLVGTVSPNDLIRVQYAESPDPNAPEPQPGEPPVTRKLCVNMAYLSRRILKKQIEESTTRVWDEKERKSFEIFDQQKHGMRYIRELLPSGDPIPPDMFLDLVELEAGIELDVELDENGNIPWSHDSIVFSETRKGKNGEPVTVNYSVPMMLYEFAKPSRFKLIVEGAQQDWHAIREQQKKKGLMTSPASAG